MPMTKEELTEYVTDLCKQKNYTPEQTKKAVEMATGNDEVALLLGPIIDLPLGRQAAFSREMNTLKEKHAALDTWHRGAKTTYEQSQARAQELDAKVKKYTDQFGELDDDGNANNRRQQQQQQPDIDERLATARQQHLRLTVDLGRVRARHAKMFKGEIIDDSELLMKVAEAASDPVNPRNITIDDAYTLINGDRIKAEQDRLQTEHDQQLRNEGALAERKRLQSSIGKSGAQISESSTLFTAISTSGDKKNEDRNRSDEDRISMFEEDFSAEVAKREQQQQTTSTAT